LKWYCVCIVRSVYSVYLTDILNKTEYIVTQLRGQKGNGDMQAAKRDIPRITIYGYESSFGSIDRY